MTDEEIADLRFQARGLDMSAQVLRLMATIPAYANLSGPDALLAAVGKLNELMAAIKQSDGASQ